MSLAAKDVCAFVNSVLIESSQKSIDVTPLKLQKLLYLCYGHFAADNVDHDDKVIAKVTFEPWRYGPVVRDIYNNFKHYGSNAIDKLCTFAEDKKSYDFSDRFPEGKKAVIFAIGKYGKLSASDLIDVTHRAGGAWEKAFKAGLPEIKHEEIVEEFKNQ